MNIIRITPVLIAFFLVSCSPKTDYTLLSPDGNISVDLMYDKELGTLNYQVTSAGQEIVSASTVGINSSAADFRSGMKLLSSADREIDETYSIPQGKVSLYRNYANEKTLRFRKDGHDIDIVFRVYNDGVAFSFFIPGSGTIELIEESSTIDLAGENLTYWGQRHPNRYGYEGALGPVTDNRLSIPVLAHLADRDHFVLMAQAASYGNYIQPHFERDGSSFRFSFPLDQEKIGPVISELPFHSPWRMLIISPGNPAGIVESYLVENLNPPTDPELLNIDGTVKEWVKPGRVMWDFIAGDRDKPKMWIDAAADMGWEYYMADAGFVNRFGGEEIVREATAYAALKNIGVIGWAHTRDYDTYDKGSQNMRRYADMGIKGAKIDFFDHNTLDENPREWRDYEDTQASLQMRDWIFELGIENEFLLEVHGNTMPTGERRRYPHLMTLEGVDGMERRTKPASNDLTIPYTRNVMGPVSYTIIHFERSPGTHAYQMAMSVVYEAGMMIYAEHGQQLLSWPGREMIKDVPSAWDETRFIDGMPGSHIIIARRKGEEWFIGGMTGEARSVKIPLSFLADGRNFNALIFRDETHTTMHMEEMTVSSGSSLSLDMLERGGFTMRISP